MNKFTSETEIIEYLIINKIINEEKTCYRCKNIMIINRKKKLYVCNKKNCRNTVSLFKNTFFATCKLNLLTLFELCYLYLHKTPASDLSTILGISTATVTEWTYFIRQLVGDAVEESTMKIGGDGIIVELDETKMGKRKYHRGHKVEGVWVVCGIERTKEKKYFAIDVENRNSDTIKSIILNYVNPGSIIYTDMWKSYNVACEFLNFEHYTVNHSKTFKDIVTGVHTNTVEGYNNGLKTLIKPRNRTKKGIRHHLLYYIWRKQNKKNIWNGFIDALRKIKYIYNINKN